MYKQCRTEQSAARQRELLAGLQDAMNQQHYDEITVSGLCEYMQIPRKSFYRYFSSKEGALHALIDYSLLDSDSFREKWLKGSVAVQEELEQLFAYWYQKKHLLDALANSGLSGVLVQRAIGHAVEETSRDKTLTNQDQQNAQKYSTLYAVSGIMSLVIQWHHDGYPQTPKQMAKIAHGLVTRPLIPNL